MAVDLAGLVGAFFPFPVLFPHSGSIDRAGPLAGSLVCYEQAATQYASQPSTACLNGDGFGQLVCDL